MKNNKQPYTIHLGFSGFPRGTASVQRTRLTFKGLALCGHQPLIINKISHHEKGYTKKIAHTADQIRIVNTAWLPYRPDSFIARNINKLSGYVGEFLFLVKKRKQIKTAIVYSNYFAEFPYYWMLSKILGFKLIHQYVEFFSKIPGRNSFFTRLNDRLIDYHIQQYCDGIIGISNYLIQHIQTKAPNKPIIKLPAVCDFDELKPIPLSEEGPFIMYCGTIYYEAVIEFIIDIFDRLKKDCVYDGKLMLVISGNQDGDWDQLQQRLNQSPAKDLIIVKNNIPYSTLLSLYKTADLLLIPLRNTIQDIARFPHKVGEYTAAGRPVVSTNVGELKQYFTDGENALLTDEYDLDQYVQKIKSVITDPTKYNAIGNKGHELGLAKFDYHSQGKSLHQFIEQLHKK